jgi:asparagine synthase (glutamine-hydrolysing)
MTASLVHRGPDDVDVVADGDVCFGFRRLAIQDLTPAGRQPMRSHDGRLLLVFNGEIYNHLELRSRLEAGGPIAWRGRSDSETLLEAIGAWGLRAALQAADGMFALAVWDRESRTLQLARDAFGEKPLCYAAGGERFAFASEVRALEAGGLAAADGLDHGAVGAFLRYGYVPAPQSIWRAVRKLAPGAMLTVGLDLQPREETWFDLAGLIERSRSDPFTDEAQAADALDALLSGVVASRMLSDAPLGAFLSGGVDSSLVTAKMQAAAGARPVRTFTLGFERPEFDEAPYARDVAHWLGTAHTELIATEADARALAPRLGELYDEPFADPSQIPTLMVSQLARREVTVCLTGDGGDEMFGGYSRYAGAPRLWRALRHVPGRGAIASAMQAAPLRLLDAAGAALGPVARRYAAKGGMGSTLRQVGQWIDAPSQEALYDRTLSLWMSPQQLIAADASGWRAPGRTPQGLDPTEAMIWRDTVDYLPGDILCKVDRASMAHSLETRAPFLAPSVAALAWRLPTAMKVRGERTKHLLREVLDRHVPQRLTDRPKRGFTPPIHDWLTGPLHQWARDLTAPERLQRQGLLQSAPVEALWRRALAGDASVAPRLWAVATVQGWLVHRGL